MLALVVALLSFAVGPPGALTAASWAAETPSGQGADAAHAAEPCCETADDPSPDPCPPGEPCAPGGGCCACACACAKRVADAPPPAPQRRAAETAAERVAAPESTGIDGGGAVWHPPRG